MRKIKIFHTAHLFLFLFVLTLFFGCKKESTTGGLQVRVAIAGSVGYLSGANVMLATSQHNLDIGAFLLERISDSNGKVDFGQLDPGNYFLGCSGVENGITHYGEGQVLISAGENKDVLMTIQ